MRKALLKGSADPEKAYLEPSIPLAPAQLALCAAEELRDRLRILFHTAMVLVRGKEVSKPLAR